MKYNVQCTNGHVFTAPKGSELERRCKERAKKGYLDALILNSSECDECQAERDERMLDEANDFDACFHA